MMLCKFSFVFLGDRRRRRSLFQVLIIRYFAHLVVDTPGEYTGVPFPSSGGGGVPSDRLMSRRGTSDLQGTIKL